MSVVIALYILLGIIISIYILLHIPVVTKVKVVSNNTKVTVKYLCFTVLPIKTKPKKLKKNAKKKKKNKKNVTEKTEKKESFMKKFNAIKPYIPVGTNALKRFVKTVKIKKLYVKIDVADEDAYECAIKFGKINSLVYSALALSQELFKVNVKKIEINSNFNQPKTEFDINFRVKIRPSAVIIVALRTLINFVSINKKINEKTRKKSVKA